MNVPHPIRLRQKVASTDLGGPGKKLLSELILGGHGANRPHCPGPSYSSYLTLPTVDLETLKTEFQDDSPPSGTVLRRRKLAKADVTSQA